MPFVDLFCPFCGAAICEDPYAGDHINNRPRPRRPWYAEAQGIITDFARPNLPSSFTGIGVIRDTNILYYPPGGGHYLSSGELLPAQICEERYRWGFAIHSACCEILAQRTRYQAARLVLKSVAKLLAHIPCSPATAFDFGHDYEGAAKYHDQTGDIEVDFSLPFLADPAAIPSLPQLERSIPPNFTRALVVPNAAATPFAPFSTEAIDRIISYLSPQDILSIRLTSRAMKEFADRPPPPDIDWQRQVVRYHTLDFPASGSPVPQNWRRAYFGILAALRGNVHMLNRRRIRRLVEHVVVVLELDAKQLLLDGLPVEPTNMRLGAFQLDDMEGNRVELKTMDSFSGEISLTELWIPLRKGCRLSEYRAESLNIHGPNRQSISISTVKIGGRVFISAIGLPPVGLEHNRWLGYCNPATETAIDIPHNGELFQIRVAFCDQGLRGLQLVYKDGTSSDWVGDSDGDVALGTLHVPPEMSHPNYLVAGFDPYKIVYLGVTFGVGETEPSKPSMTDRQLWWPSAPRHDELSISDSLRDPAPCSYQLLLNFDYGGPGGSRLKALTRIVVEVGPEPMALCRMRAVYERDLVHDPIANSCEISFAIGGKSGERIQAVYALGVPICGMTLYTNFDRAMTFGVIEDQFKSQVRRRIGRETKGKVITGLICGNRGQLFSHLAAQLQPSVDTTTFSRKEGDNVPDGVLEYAQKLSLYTGSKETYHTYASLIGVRRISASRGIEGRSRSPNCISGLKLKYEDGASEILGQWMQECSTFELDTDEEISYICVVYSHKSPGRVWSIRYGQVAAVFIATNRRRSILFSALNEPLQGSAIAHTHSRYGSLDVKLTGVSWILNSSYDRVRGVSSSVDKRHSIALPVLDSPHGDLQKLYFERTDEERRDPVVFIRAHFNGTALLGLTFMYRSTSVAVLGDVGDAIATETRLIEIKDEEYIVGMCVQNEADHIRSIKFSVKQGPGQGADRVEKVLAATLKHHRIPTDKDEALQVVYCENEAQARTIGPFYQEEYLYTPHPGTKLVGLYAQCQNTAFMGALFEHNDHLN